MVGEICSKPAVTISPTATVQEAAYRMRSRQWEPSWSSTAAKRPWES
jgi:hypothetical protein